MHAYTKRNGDPWTRDETHEDMATIIMQTRGVDEEDCVPTATLFEGLGLESIDFLELSFRMEETWGFPYPTDDMGAALQCFGETTSLAAAEEGLRILREHLFIDVPIDIKGLNPYEPNVLRQAATDLLTVGHLVTYIEKHLNR